MKKNKKLFLVFMCGLVLGAVIAGIITAGFLRGRQNRNEKAVFEQTDIEQTDIEQSTSEQMDSELEENKQEPAIVESDETEVSGETEESNDTWEASMVYVGGDEVAYQGKIYRAKWWTQGEEPGKADVWEDTLVAAGESMDSALDSAVTTEEPSDGTDDINDNQTKKADNPEVAKREDFKVVGYFPSWKENIDKIQYDVLTHINYAFAIPTEDGGLRPLENEGIAQKIIKEAHANDVKVFLAIGGWSYHEVPLEPTFVAATETEEKVEAFADEIVAMCDRYGFDGVDLDWEHPRVDGNSSKQYEALIVALAERLHAEDKQLSSAVLSGVTADGNIYYDAAAHTDKVLETVDWINVMAYDGGDGKRHSAYDFAVNCGNYWRKVRKMPAEKVVLGVPFYARPSWAAYGDILSQVPDAWNSDHTDYNGMEAWYNGVATIEKKTDYALENLGGVMIWEVSQDASGKYSLQTAIGKTIAKNK